MAYGSVFTDAVLLEITGADIAAILDRLGQRGITLYDMKTTDELTVQIRCKRKDLKQIRIQTEKAGGSLKVLNFGANERTVSRIFQRPILLLSAIILFVLVVLLPTRILFVRVEGNATVPTDRILDEAVRSGISFGASRRAIRNEAVKNTLVSAIPELQWVGINTKGCVATISVREKSARPDEQQITGPGRIISTRDGIIHSCTVLNGTALCKVGDAVVAGQTLVSGYVDCGIALKTVRAEGEITAQTHRQLFVVTPVTVLKRQTLLHTQTRYSLRIGKKLINFYKDSGISDTSCVKMYSEDYLTLPGGFQLPVALVTERCAYYTVSPQETSDTELWMQDYCKNYLLGTMQAGLILEEETCLLQDSGVYCFYGEYVCLEMIGQFVNEEIVSNDGQTD